MLTRFKNHSDRSLATTRSSRWHRCATGLMLVLLLQSRAQAQDFAGQAEKLLAQMTLAEKVGQMTQVDSDALKRRPDDVQKYFIGSVLSGGGSSPATGTNSLNVNAYCTCSRFKPDVMGFA
jgi:hypothetical protein